MATNCGISLSCWTYICLKWTVIRYELYTLSVSVFYLFNKFISEYIPSRMSDSKEKRIDESFWSLNSEILSNFKKMRSIDHYSFAELQIVFPLKKSLSKLNKTKLWKVSSSQILRLLRDYLSLLKGRDFKMRILWPLYMRSPGGRSCQIST